MDNGDWSVKVKAASDLFNLSFEESIVSPEFAHHLTTEAEELHGLQCLAKIDFPSLTYHVWHQIALFDIDLPVYSQTRLRL